MLNKEYSILHLPGWYPNRTNATLGNFVQKHAEAARIFCDVSVLYACPDEHLGDKDFEIVIENVSEILTIIVYYKKINAGGSVFSSIRKFRRFLDAYKIGYQRLLEEKGKPDLVHLNILIKAGIMALYLKFKVGLEYVYSENWTGFLPSNPIFRPYSFEGLMYRFIANRSKVLMPVTENLKGAMIRNGIKGSYKIIPNVVDTDVFKPFVTGKLNGKGNDRFEGIEVENGKFRFIHISHAVDGHKNVSGILRAVEKLKNINPDFVLKIVSDGIVSNHIAYAKELGIYGSHVVFEGTKSTEDVARELKMSQCLVLFSYYENLPCVIPEAMACGVPVISSNVGGIAEYLSDEMGILVSPLNENELVLAMKTMMENFSRYATQKLRAFSVKNFSYDTIGGAFYSVYKEVLKKAHELKPIKEPPDT